MGLGNWPKEDEVRIDPRFIACHCVRFQFLFSLPVVNWGIKRDQDRLTRSDKNWFIYSAV